MQFPVINSAMEPLLCQAEWKGEVLSRWNVEPGRHQTSPNFYCLPVQMEACSTPELFVESKTVDVFVLDCGGT